MKVLKIYDPAMCCPTGVCGTDIDPKLVSLANFLTTLDKSKFEVQRYGLTSEPQAYVENSEVAKILKEEGVESLPLFFVDEEVVFKGFYPEIPALSSKLGLASFVALV